MHRQFDLLGRHRRLRHRDEPVCPVPDGRHLPEQRSGLPGRHLHALHGVRAVRVARRSRPDALLPRRHVRRMCHKCQLPSQDANLRRDDRHLRALHGFHPVRGRQFRLPDLLGDGDLRAVRRQLGLLGGDAGLRPCLEQVRAVPGKLQLLGSDTDLRDRLSHLLGLRDSG